MRERPDLQVDQHERAGQPVVENQVDPVMLAVERDALLAGHEGKALAEFQEELAELVDQRLLKVRFKVSLALRQAGELQDVRVFDEVAGLLDFVSLLGQRQHAFPIPAQRQPLEQQGVNLPLQFAGGPTGS